MQRELGESYKIVAMTVFMDYVVSSEVNFK